MRPSASFRAGGRQASNRSRAIAVAPTRDAMGVSTGPSRQTDAEPLAANHPLSSSALGKARSMSTSTACNESLNSSKQMRLKPIPPPGLRLLSSLQGGGSSNGGISSGRPGMDSEADLGRHFYLNKVLEQWAAKPATRMTLRQLIFFGRSMGRDREKILKSANYVRQELPVRIAHRIRDLQALPFVVMTNQNLEQVYQKYWSAFETFRRFPHIKNMDDNERFCNLLRRLLDDHLTIIPSLTIGIVESSHHLQPQQLDKFMERMLRSRISRRVLAEQHIALSEALDDPFHFFNEPAMHRNHENDHDRESAEENDEDAVGDHVGIIYTRLSVASVVNKGIKLLSKMFADVQGVTPDRMPRIQVDGDLRAKFAYIPEHLEYIVFELLKNAIRATIRRHAGQPEPGSVKVTIVEGPPEEDLIIRISDSGGGLPDLIAQLSSPTTSAHHGFVAGVGTPIGLGVSPHSHQQQHQQHQAQNGGQAGPGGLAASSTPGSLGPGEIPGGIAGAGVNDHQYPIPFPDMGHIGGYPPRGSRARLHPDRDTIPVTLQDDALPLPQGMGGVAGGYSDAGMAGGWSTTPGDSGGMYTGAAAPQGWTGHDMNGESATFASSAPPLRGGVGSAGGVGGSSPPNEFGTVGTSATVASSIGGYSDPLIDALCSFSNVRKRLEIEEQQTARAAALLQQRLEKARASQAADAQRVRGVSEAEAIAAAAYGYAFPGSAGDNTSPLQSEAGLGTRHRFHALKTIGKFKGTVTEQVAANHGARLTPVGASASASDAATSASQSVSRSPSLSAAAAAAETPAATVKENPTTSTSAATPTPGAGTAAFKFKAVEGTGPAALHTVQVETGLGLPMAKVYCDFFGGSLSFRSLDGHSTDIYIRLPKLGTNKETIEEIVL